MEGGTTPPAPPRLGRACEATLGLLQGFYKASTTFQLGFCKLYSDLPHGLYRLPQDFHKASKCFYKAFLKLSQNIFEGAKD